MREDRQSSWKSGSWAVEGIGEDFIPDIADMSLVTEAYEIDDEESFAVARELLRKEGIFGGSSTGTLVAGALRYCREQKQAKRVVTFVSDTGNKYLSKMFNDFWMAEQGFIHRPPHGDLSDLISHRYENRRSHLGWADRHVCSLRSSECGPAMSRNCRWSIKTVAPLGLSMNRTCW